MAFPLAPSPFPPGSTDHNPALSGTFIRTIWSTRLIEELYNATVLSAIANHDYEAEISGDGDTLNILKTPTITVRPYSANSALILERPSADKVQLVIDKGLYFATILDDVLRRQSWYDLFQIWTSAAGWSLKVAVDTAVLATLPVALIPQNTGSGAGKVSGIYTLGAAGSPLTLVPQGVTVGAGEQDVMSLITNMSCILAEQQVPPEDRWLVIPNWMGGFLRRSSAFRSAQDIGDGTSVFRTGYIGMVEGMPVYESNLLPRAVEGTGQNARLCWWAFMGQIQALTFASQIQTIGTITHPETFAEILRGLYTYGSVVVDPRRLVGAYVVPKAGLT